MVRVQSKRAANSRVATEFYRESGEKRDARDARVVLYSLCDIFLVARREFCESSASRRRRPRETEPNRFHDRTLRCRRDTIWREITRGCAIVAAEIGGE